MRRVLSLILAIGLILNFSIVPDSFALVVGAEETSSAIPAPIDLNSREDFSVGVNTYEWQTMNFFNSISRWGIMIFIMISGALFLNRDIFISSLLIGYAFCFFFFPYCTD